MNYGRQTTSRIVARHGKGLGAKLAAGLVIVGIAAGSAMAQTQPKAPAAAPKAPAAPAAAAPATAAAAAPASPPIYWVKLCEKAQVPVPEKDGKVTAQERNICLTHHERLDGNSGLVIVSAALRQVEGSEKQHLMVMVPIAIGVAIPAGLRAAVYNKEVWAKAQKNETYDEKQLKPVDLKYTLCHPTGCTAEIEATKEMIDNLKSGGGLVILAMNGQAQPVPFSIPLDGFAVAQAGAPADAKAYGQQRELFFNQLRARQEEEYKKFLEQQQRLAPKELVPPPAPAAKKP